MRRLHSFLADMMGQIDDLSFKEITFGRFQLESMFPESVKYYTHPLQMLFWGFGIHYYIIQVDETIGQIQLPQAVLHEVLKISQSITETKWHLITLKETHTAQGESCEFFRLLLHRNLPKLRSQVECGVVGRAYKTFKAFTNARQWMRVLSSESIEFPKIYAKL